MTVDMSAPGFFGYGLHADGNNEFIFGNPGLLEMSVSDHGPQPAAHLGGFGDGGGSAGKDPKSQPLPPAGVPPLQKPAGNASYPSPHPRTSAASTTFQGVNVSVETPALSSGSSTTPDSLPPQKAATPSTNGARPARYSRARARKGQPRPPISVGNPRQQPGRNKASMPNTPIKGEDDDDDDDGDNANDDDDEDVNDDDDADGDLDDNNPKRVRFLERNRVAATKCRQKKKEWVSDLEGTKSSLETRNRALRAEYDGLMDEVTRVRAQLVDHAACCDSKIDQWIENEAKRFVVESGERYDQILIGMGHDPNFVVARHHSLAALAAQGYNTPDLDAISPASATPSHRPNLALHAPPPPQMAHMPPPSPAVLGDHFSQMAQQGISPVDAAGAHPGPGTFPMPMGETQPQPQPQGFEPHRIAIDPGY